MVPHHDKYNIRVNVCVTRGMQMKQTALFIAFALALSAMMLLLIAGSVAANGTIFSD